MRISARTSYSAWLPSSPSSPSGRQKMKFQPVAKKVDAEELEKTRELMKREGLLKADVDVKRMIYVEP